MVSVSEAAIELLHEAVTVSTRRQGKSPWLLVPAAISLAIFSWLLSFHPTAAGRIYAALPRPLLRLTPAIFSSTAQTAAVSSAE